VVPGGLTHTTADSASQEGKKVDGAKADSSKENDSTQAPPLTVPAPIGEAEAIAEKVAAELYPEAAA